MTLLLLAKKRKYCIRYFWHQSDNTNEIQQVSTLQWLNNTYPLYTKQVQPHVERAENV